MTIANIVVFILAGVLGFLLLTYAAPKRFQVKAIRWLPGSPDQIWPYLSVPARYAEWNPYVTDCQLLDGVESGVGQKRLVTLDRNRVPGEREEEVSRWEENKLLILDHNWERRDGKPVRWNEAHTEYRLRPEGDGTQLTTSIWFTGVGSLGKIFSLISYRKKHEVEQRLALDHLEKRLLEDTYPS